MSKHFIVIGNPIAHSQSPEIHQNFAKQAGIKINYHRQYCPDDSQSFKAVVSAFFYGGGDGANVTVPFKQRAYELCRELGGVTPYAHIAGAVNTLYRQADILFGDNTDGRGLVKHLKVLDWSLQGAKVAIIGAGGASRGILLPLLEAGVSEITIANRTVSKADELIIECREKAEQVSDEVASLFQQAQLHYSDIQNLKGHYDLIINATSSGLYGESLALSDDLHCDTAYDMMYGKDVLPFLQHFSDKGAKISDGYGMLLYQAELSFQIWTGKTITVNLDSNPLQ